MHPAIHRRTRALAVAFAVLVALVALAAPGTSSACSCLFVSFEDEYAATDLVFTARSLSSEPSTYPDHHIERLQVFAIWKGSGYSEVMEVLVGDNDGLCGYHFTPGVDYLVFAEPYSKNYPVYTHSCSRTRPIDPNDPIWAQLGPPLSVPAMARSWGKIKSIYR
jgi:hypothetical protein